MRRYGAELGDLGGEHQVAILSFCGDSDPYNDADRAHVGLLPETNHAVELSSARQLRPADRPRVTELARHGFKLAHYRGPRMYAA